MITPQPIGEAEAEWLDEDAMTTHVVVRGATSLERTGELDLDQDELDDVDTQRIRALRTGT